MFAGRSRKGTLAITRGYRNLELAEEIMSFMS